MDDDLHELAIKVKEIMRVNKMISELLSNEVDELYKRVEVLEAKVRVAEQLYPDLSKPWC